VTTDCPVRWAQRGEVGIDNVSGSSMRQKQAHSPRVRPVEIDRIRASLANQPRKPCLF